MGGRIRNANVMTKGVSRDTPCVFDGFDEGFYCMQIAGEDLRRYFALLGGKFAEPFGKAWFSDIVVLSHVLGQGIAVTQSNYDILSVRIERVGY